jgi:hypothetical protein
MLDMISFNTVLDNLPRYTLALLTLSCLYGAYRLLSATYIWPNYISALRTIPGPENPSFLYGNYEQIYNAPDEAAMLEHWGEQHGHVLKFNGPFNVSDVVCLDNSSTHLRMHRKNSCTPAIFGPWAISSIRQTSTRNRTEPGVCLRASAAGESS